MSSLGFLYFLCIVTGFGLLHAPLQGVFTIFLPIINPVGVIAILFFSFALLFEGLRAFFRLTK